jgi:hypothetical protein
VVWTCAGRASYRRRALSVAGRTKWQCQCATAMVADTTRFMSSAKTSCPAIAGARSATTESGSTSIVSALAPMLRNSNSDSAAEVQSESMGQDWCANLNGFESGLDRSSDMRGFSAVSPNNVCSSVSITFFETPIRTLPSSEDSQRRVLPWHLMRILSVSRPELKFGHWCRTILNLFAVTRKGMRLACGGSYSNCV